MRRIAITGMGITSCLGNDLDTVSASLRAGRAGICALPDHAERLFQEGVLLNGDDKPTLPAVLERIDERTARLTIQEGRYHQVKRMFASLGNLVLTLHRERIGPVALDADLALGESRYLTPAEVQALVSDEFYP